MPRGLNLEDKSLHIFAKRIKELRMERNFSLDRLSQLIPISRSAISNYELELRKPAPSVLVIYSEFFNVPIDYLLGKTDVRDPLYQVACFSNLSTKDFGMLSKKAQKDIKNFIADVMARELKDEE